MEQSKRMYIIETLAALDPDYLVDVLGISSRELMMAFPVRLEEHIEEEYGDIEGEEEDFDGRDAE